MSDLEKKILDYKYTNQEISILGQDIALVYDLFNKHIYWSNLFELIEKYTLEDVYFGGFTAGSSGGLSLNASGKSYDSAARQLKLLQSEEAKEFVKSASINSVISSGDSVQFNVNLVLNDKLFFYDFKKVLFIEDGEWEFDSAYEDMFRDEDLIFFGASTGRESLALLERENPDIIFLDLNLTSTSSLGILEEIQAEPRINELPILIIVESRNDRSIEDALELGATDFILQSDISPEYILSAIKSYLDN